MARSKKTAEAEAPAKTTRGRKAVAEKPAKTARASKSKAADGEEKVYKCLSKRSTKRNDERKRALTARVNRAAGQISGLQGLLENDAYCTDILVQVAAVQSALKAFSRELIIDHLEHVVAGDLKKGETKSLDEFTKVLQKQFMNG